MFDGGQVHARGTKSRSNPSSPRRAAIDGLIVGGREVWVVVASSSDDVAALLRTEPVSPGEPPLLVCRAVLEGGFVLLGATDPETDPLVSDLLRRDGKERA